MNEQEKPMQVYFGTEGNNGEWIRHFYEIREGKSREIKPSKPWAWPEHRPVIPSQLAALLDKDKEHQTNICTMKSELRQLFNAGFTLKDYTGPLDFPTVSKLPKTLCEAMLTIQADIRRNVLILKQIPPPVWIQVAETAPPPMKPTDSDDGFFAHFDDQPIRIAAWLIYHTEAINDADERAIIVFGWWYPNAARKIIKETNKSCRLQQERIAEVSSIMGFKSTETLLTTLKIHPIDRAIWYAFKDGWQLDELGEAGRRLGKIYTSPESIQRVIDQVNDKLRRSAQVAYGAKELIKKVFENGA